VHHVSIGMNGHANEAERRTDEVDRNGRICIDKARVNGWADGHHISPRW
jgi:hypothetical protein